MRGKLCSTCSHEVNMWWVHGSFHMQASTWHYLKNEKKKIPTTGPMRTCAQQHIGTKISAEGHTYFECDKPNYFSRAGPSEQPHVAKLAYTIQPVSARDSKGKLTGESN